MDNARAEGVVVDVAFVSFKFSFMMDENTVEVEEDEEAVVLGLDAFGGEDDVV